MKLERKSRTFAILFGIIALFFSTYHSTEAANLIKPSQSRVTYILKDMNDVAYNVYFAGVKEKKGYASYDKWPYVWAGANEGDLVYKGNYTLYIQKIGTSTIQKSRFYFKDYELNTTRQMVHLFPSRYKGQPSILAVAKTTDSNFEQAQWYYIKDGVLTKIVDAVYTKRAKSIAVNKFQIAGYIAEEDYWYFSDLIFNPKKNSYGTDDAILKNQNQALKNWPKHWQ